MAPEATAAAQSLLTSPAFTVDGDGPLIRSIGRLSSMQQAMITEGFLVKSEDFL
jgi:hypothetical protein